jgi:creatinine amidohydrolase
MPLLRWEELTWTDFALLDRERSPALLPVGAIEAHGPHLPLGTDGIIAEAMVSAAARRLQRHGLTPLVLPRLVYTAAPFAAAFPGTLSLRADAVTTLIVELARSLAAAGLPLIALANSHFDPKHVRALRAAAATVRAEGRIAIAFPDLTRRALASRLTEEFQSGACHAGRYESSIVLAARPELVREEVRRELPENPASLAAAIGSGLRTFAEAGGPQAYFGDPAAAAAAEGEATIAVLGEILEEAVLAELAARGAETPEP